MYEKKVITPGGLAPNLGDNSHSSSREADIRDLLLGLRRRKWVIVNTVLLITTVVAILVFQMTPRYTAEAIIALDTRQNQVVDLQAVMSGIRADAAAIRTEIDVIRSRHLIGRVVDTMGLMEDPEFNAALRDDRSILSYLNPLNYMPEDVLLSLGMAKGNTLSEEERLSRQRASVINAFQNKLVVQNAGLSYTITLSFESANAKKAADIVNALAEAYMTDQLEAKFEATQRASQWLNSRIDNLRQRVRDAELAAQAYREQHQLISTENAGLVADQQLTELNRDLVEARTELARYEARYNQLDDLVSSGVEAAGLIENLESAMIQRLREQRAELLRRRAELSTRYGPKHPRMINLVAEIRDVDAGLEAEARKAVNNARSEVQVARARLNALESTLSELTVRNVEQNRAQVQLRELEREAEANRVLLETFLTRFKETSSQEDLQQADARIISVADIPTTPSSPRKKLIFAVTLFLSLSLGVALAAFLEASDEGFRNFEHVQNVLGLKGVGMIPLLTKEKLEGLLPEDYFLKKPMSAFSEAHRNVHAALLHSGPRQSTPQVLLFTSSVPGEGKSTLAFCYARLSAKMGKRTLLIEADMRRPVLKKRIQMEGKEPMRLNVSLEGDLGEGAKQYFYQDDETSLHLLVSDVHDDPQKLFTSQKFNAFMTWARENYDCVIIDSPPVMAVSDAIILSHVSDAVVYAIQWGNTPRKSAKEAITALARADAQLAGIVLTQVDVKRHQAYGYTDQGYYYGSKGGGYYSN